MLSASTSDAYSMVFKLLADAGDEVLVPRPSYPLFDHLTRLDGVTAVPYDLEYHDRVDDRHGERRARADAADPRAPDRQPQQPDRVVRESARARAPRRTSAPPADVAIIADEVFIDYESSPARARSLRL